MNTKGIQKRTALKRDVFLRLYAEKGNITKSCEAAEIGRQTYYDWMNEDSEFAGKFKIADQIFCDSLEAEMDRRAKEGIDKPIYYKGERVDTIKEYSDVLLIVRAKAKMPEKYRERSDTSISGKVTFEVVREQKMIEHEE